jgi:hypothetical protein
MLGVVHIRGSDSPPEFVFFSRNTDESLECLIDCLANQCRVMVFPGLYPASKRSACSDDIWLSKSHLDGVGGGHKSCDAVFCTEIVHIVDVIMIGIQFV